MEILSLSQVDDRELYVDQIKDIFFESSAIKEFKSTKLKREFYEIWCEIYISNFPEYFLLAVEDEKLLGYLSGCPNTLEHLSLFSMPGLQEFSEELKDFQAHFHINCHHEHRGVGVGKYLTDHFCKKLLENDIKSVFIITGAMTRPTSFYLKMGFCYSFTKWLENYALIMMGKKL